LQISQDTIRWTIHPARENPKRTLGAVMIILCFSGIVLFSFSSVEWALFSFFILFLSLMRYFIPTSYKLNQLVIESSFLGICKKRKWNEFKRIRSVKGGIFLSPFEKPHRLESFRGVFLMCRRNLNEVFDFAQKHIAKEEKIAS